jgi:O-antigen/teichoic acid export membrane protein
VVNVGGNMLLIPALGMNGAAIAWGASIAVDSGLSFAQVRWRMGIGGSLGPLAACAAAATVCFGVLPLLVRLAWAPSLAAAVVAGLLACATYAPAVWRLRHAADLRLLIDALHRRRAPTTAGRHSVARPSLGLPPVKGSA